MPEPAYAAAERLAPPVRWVLVATLVAALLLIGVYSDPVLDFLTLVWQRLLAAVGLDQRTAALQRGIDTGITKRMLPAVATYAALYLNICLLLLWLLLTRVQWLLVLRLYAGTLLVYGAIVVAGKLAGDAQWAYRLGRHLLDFVVSPLPVVGFYVLFRSGFEAGPPRA